MDIMKAADQIYAGSARPDLHLPLGTLEAIAHECRCAPAIKPDGSLLLDNNDKQVSKTAPSLRTCRRPPGIAKPVPPSFMTAGLQPGEGGIIFATHTKQTSCLSLLPTN